MATTMPRVLHNKGVELKEAFFIFYSSRSGTFSAPMVEALLPFVASCRSDKSFDVFLKACTAESKVLTTFEKFFTLVSKLYSMSVFPEDEVEEDRVSADLCAAFAPLAPMIPAWWIQVSSCYDGKGEQAVTAGAGEPPPSVSAGTTIPEKGRVHYKAFVINLVATSISTPHFNRFCLLTHGLTTVCSQSKACRIMKDRSSENNTYYCS